MNILYWTERFWPHIGGVEILSLELIPALAKRGYDTQVITSHSAAQLPDQDQYRGIDIHRFDFLTSLTRRDLKQMIGARMRLSKFKQRFKPDLVHIHFSGPSPYFHWQTQNAHPAPTLITIHSLPTELHDQNSLLVQTLKSADWVNTVSQAKLNDIRALVPELAERSSVIYNGRATPAVEPAPLPMEPPTLLCLGRLVRWKGFDLALEALARLLPENPAVTMVIAGDGPERTELENQAIKLGIQNQVEFKGWVDPDQIPDLLNKATAVLLPSRAEETLPVVALQAAQMARPILAADIAGLPETVLHEQTGLLFTPDDPEALAGAIHQVLTDPGKARQLGRAAHDRALEEQSLERCVENYDQLYRKLRRRFQENNNPG